MLSSCFALFFFLVAQVKVGTAQSLCYGADKGYPQWNVVNFGVSPVNWNSAQEYCQMNFGTDLAAIRDATEEADFLDFKNDECGWPSMAMQHTAIGATVADDCDTIEWLDGSADTGYRNWCTVMPMSCGIYKCVQFSNYFGDCWGNYDCTDYVTDYALCGSTADATTTRLPTIKTTTAERQSTAAPTEKKTTSTRLPTKEQTEKPTDASTIAPTHHKSTEQISTDFIETSATESTNKAKTGGNGNGLDELVIVAIGCGSVLLVCVAVTVYMCGMKQEPAEGVSKKPEPGIEPGTVHIQMLMKSPATDIIEEQKPEEEKEVAKEIIVLEKDSKATIGVTVGSKLPPPKRQIEGKAVAASIELCKVVREANASAEGEYSTTRAPPPPKRSVDEAPASGRLLSSVTVGGGAVLRDTSDVPETAGMVLKRPPERKEGFRVRTKTEELVASQPEGGHQSEDDSEGSNELMYIDMGTSTLGQTQR